MIDVRAIRQQHIGKGALILVVTVGLERDFLPKPRSATACLACLPNA